MDVIGFGLANIDLVARVTDAFLAQHGVPKGGDLPTDSLSFGRMRASLPQFEATPGGCVANTLCGLSVMGIDTHFYGKIGHDEFESLYRTSFREYRVGYEVAAAETESSQCAVLITPDGERSFTQVEGTSFLLQESDVDWETVARAQLLYAENYVCSFGGNSDLFERLCATAKRHAIPLYIKIVDQKHATRDRDLLRHHAQDGAIRLIAGNQDNLPSLIGAFAPTQISEGFKAWPCSVLMTAAIKGGTYFEDGFAYEFGSEPVSAPKNSSGAGDQFMAGFIAGRLDNRPLEDCLALGSRTARAILMHNQPRPPLQSRQTIRF